LNLGLPARSLAITLTSLCFYM